jgi:hypothetical protein
MRYQETQLIDNKEQHSYELWVENKRSFIDYKLENDQSVLLHTEVPEELEGKGIAAALVEKTFQYLEEQNMKVVPVCSYVLTYLKRYPKWNHLVA